MRLTKIKLAGFKSFVDPTVIHLPSNLVGVVGPNGCGKSNIIDAVRWVMGESSARTLRGDSMADVIFTGSSARKPVGQAFVELIFDNSEARLGGPWAHYNEIAIKRLVARDGQSSYFLNGTRCRRRDITGIFLGTGLGPRSYAIIEQGMISRIIEAKPEELRVFFEEAAGISKYKERRRETETRIRHTRENLERLNDLREELATRLQHLQRQARVAEQYQQYRAQERRVKAELLALRWRDLDAEVAEREHAIRDRETAAEAVVARQRAVEAPLEAGRERYASLNAEFNRVQGCGYEIGAEIARLEQGLAHRREWRRRERDELVQVEQALDRILQQVRFDETRLAELDRELGEGEPAWQAAQVAELQAGERLATVETAIHDDQLAWESFTRRAAEPQRKADVERTRIEHLERHLLQHRRRAERLRLERDGLQDSGLQEELEGLRLRERASAASLEALQAELDEIDARVEAMRETQRRVSAQLDEIRERVQTGRGRLVSLETLQEAALGRHVGIAQDWLKARCLDGSPRLAEWLSVDGGWEQAVEIVLGRYLQAVCVEDLEGPAVELGKLEQGRVTLFATGAASHGEVAKGRDALLDKVRCPWPLDSLLGGVRVAANVSEALLRRAQLEHGESLVTPDGIWLGRDWLRAFRGEDERSGILAREREIRTLSAALDRDAEILDGHGQTLEGIRMALGELERHRGAVRIKVDQGHREHTRVHGQINAVRTRLEQVQARRRAIGGELQELHHQQVRDAGELQDAHARLEEAGLAMEQLTEAREALCEQRKALRAEFDECRRRADAARGKAQQLALALESLRAAQDSTRQAVERLQVQRAQLAERREQLATALATGIEPLEILQLELEELLSSRVRVEEAAAQAGTAIQDQEGSLRVLEQERTACEHELRDLRQDLEAQRLAWSEARVRRQTLVDQLGELQVDVASVVAELPETAVEVDRQARLEQLARRIQRLGAINLAAIEEFAQLAERKQYLDAQNDDLVEALTTLEAAMRKIDRETRARFADTFDRVNEGLQQLFPRLFGGGHAHLQLTAEDVLDAGVAIMARPPGKRIGNIHLLSGGEKALTAVALVFAIFQLNPAPFCMLDEVDAPLDEANVGRFCDLVREMSEQVQFIFITHNKGTMEIARHLSGVTMHEPGVSRLVAVDVDAAVRLAAV